MTLAANELFSSATQGSAKRVIPEAVTVAKFGAGSGTLAVLTPVGFDDVNNVWGVWTAKTAEINTITSGGSPPTSGYFTLTVNGEKTAPLAYNATAAAIQAALILLEGVGVGGVTAAATTEANLGVAAAVVTITWAGKVTARDISISLDWIGALEPTFPTVSALETADGDWGATTITCSIDGTVVSTTLLGDTTAVATIPQCDSLEAPDANWNGAVVTCKIDGVTVAAVTLGTIGSVADAVADLNGTEGLAGGFIQAGLFATANTILEITAPGHAGAHTLNVTCDLTTAFGADPGVSDTGTAATVDDDTDAEVVAALNADTDFQAAGLFADVNASLVRIRALGTPGAHKLGVYSDLATAYGADPGVENTGSDAPAAHVLATSTPGVTAGGRHVIRGFVYPQAITLDSGYEVQGNILTKGKLRYADIVTPAGEAAGAILAALRDGPLARGLVISGLTLVR